MSACASCPGARCGSWPNRSAVHSQNAVAADADRRPLVLGEGKRLFENGVLPRGLSLVATRSTPRGVLLNTYRPPVPFHSNVRSEEHTSELQSLRHLVCRLLLEKKKTSVITRIKS